MSTLYPDSRAASRAFWPFLADRKRELVLAHDDLGDLVVLVDPHFFDLGRTESFGDELRGVLPPLDDIDLLAPELVDHLAHPGTPRAHAGSLGIDVGIVGDNRDLGPMARLAGDSHDFDGAIGQFGNFELEQPPNQVGMAAADDDLRALGLVSNLEDQRLDPVASLQPLVGYALGAREDRLGVARGRGW